MLGSIRLFALQPTLFYHQKHQNPDGKEHSSNVNSALVMVANLYIPAIIYMLQISSLYKKLNLISDLVLLQ